MKEQKGVWYEKNQAKLNETSNKEKAAAIAELRAYVTENLRGRTQYGAHSAQVLGCEAEDYYIEKAWEKLFYGIWEWKDGRTLAEQLKRAASSLMQKQVKKWRNKEAGKSRTDEVWDHIAHLDVEKMSSEVGCMTDDGRLLTDEEMQLEAAYELMLEVVRGKPEQVAYLLEVKKGGGYDEIAEAMGISVHEVKLVERRVLRRLSAYRVKGPFLQGSPAGSPTTPTPSYP